MAPTPVEAAQAQTVAEFERHEDPPRLDCSAYVQAAMAEIKTVPPAAIHRESALRWSARAIASYLTCAGSKVHEERLYYLYLGDQYREAALAHASMGEPWEPLYAAINDAMQPDRAKAFQATCATAPQPRIPKARRRSSGPG